jgi:hypothetical protein
VRQVEGVPPREGRPGEDLRGVGVAVRLVAVAPARREVAAHEAEARVVEPEPDGHGALVAQAAHDAAPHARDAGAPDEAPEVGAHPHRQKDAHHLLAHHAPVLARQLADAAAVAHRVHLLPAAISSAAAAAGPSRRGRRRRGPVQRGADELDPPHPDAALVRAQHVARPQRHHLLEPEHVDVVGPVAGVQPVRQVQVVRRRHAAHVPRAREQPAAVGSTISYLYANKRDENGRQVTEPANMNAHVLVLEGLAPLLRPRPLDAAAGVRVGAAPPVVEGGVVIGDREVGDEGVAAGGLPEELVGHKPGPEDLAASMCAHRGVSYMWENVTVP